MERDLSVNVRRPAAPRGLHGEAGVGDELDRLLSDGAPFDPDEEGAPARPSAPSGLSGIDDQGPCLYFGEGGQRCNRRALENGFCRAHQGERDRLNPAASMPDKSSRNVPVRSTTPTKVLAATVAIVGILLPYIIDLAREILRWIHSQ